MTSEEPPMAVAPACAPFQEYSLNEWSSSWPTSVTNPTFHLLAADGAADVPVEGAADVPPVDGAGVAPELLQAAKPTAAAASSASAARDEEMRMFLLRCSARPRSRWRGRGPETTAGNGRRTL